MSLLGKILGSLLTVGSAVTLVTVFPSPDGAHWLGAGMILAGGAAALLADHLNKPAPGNIHTSPTPPPTQPDRAHA